MHEVFISYSSKDYPQAETVRNILEKNDIPCWMAPRDIPYGSNYAKEIPSAIRASQIFVLIMSENAQNSPWVLKELDGAVNCGKVIFPLMLEDCHLNDEFNFLLTGAQRYAAYQKKSEAMATLINRIKALTKAPEETAETAEEKSDAKEPAAPKTVHSTASSLILQCPACGSGDIRELTNKIGKFTFLEHLTTLFSFAMACALSFALLVAVILVSSSSFLYFAAFLVGAVFGWYLGNRIGNEWIRRQRVRNHIHPHPFCCNACQKKFLASSDITN